MIKTIKTISRLGVMPVIAIEDVEKTTALGEALLAGGLPCVEITFRTQAAQDAIATFVKVFPEMLVGAGTVLTIENAKKAIDAGVQFIVTPGFDKDVIEYCLKHNTFISPGVATPTDINMALKFGLNTLKFFPAEALGGIKLLKAISAPYRNVRFIPTGGVNASNLLDYLKLPQVVACGGSWMVKKQLINEGKFDTITNLVKEAVDLVKKARS
jgi:2-dehydro-3-deoxyphosphogluconate aldolase/(4S)-4-hydroxy-2-oxoglutarate aldolase